MILTREEFADEFNSLKPGLGNPDSPLWFAEEQNIKPSWFVCIKPIRISERKQEYWSWCNMTLKGQLLCYSSNSEDQQEWWGFTDQKDVVLWMLRWM